MELITTSVITLLALYVLYSEPFKLPAIIKKNKKLSYILIIGLYLYYHQNNVVEGSGDDLPWWLYAIAIIFWGYIILRLVWNIGKELLYAFGIIEE
jgi:hypothetical protein